jgi:hypothetical protein
MLIRFFLPQRAQRAQRGEVEGYLYYAFDEMSEVMLGM